MRKALIAAAALFACHASAQSYGRMDFSLQNAQGQAISGATVTVETQSACGTATTGALATLYSAASGGTPLGNPVTTDGFGHASAYVASACYTVVYNSPYTGTLTYPDQYVYAPGGFPIPGLSSDGANGIIVQGGIAMFNEAISPSNLILSNARLVCDGDSITYGTDTAVPASDNYCAQLSAMPYFSGRLTSYDNFAVPGNNTATITARYASDIQPLKPTPSVPDVWLSTFAGTNDLAACSPAGVISSLTTYWTAAKSDGFKVVAFTIPHRLIGDADGCQENTRQAINKGIRASSIYDVLIDIDEMAPNASDTTWLTCPNSVTDCGTHPTKLWHTKIARILQHRMVLPFDKPQSLTPQEWVTPDYQSFRANWSTLRNLTTGVKNSAAGFEALGATTTGSNNTAFGYGASSTNQGGSDNTCLGYVSCIFPAAQSQNTAVGSNTLVSASLAVGAATAVGYQALAALTTGSHATAVGALALPADTTGSNNTALGWAAGNGDSTASFNVFLGAQAGQGVNGDGNVVIGYQAMLPISTATKNVAIGYLSSNLSGSASQNVSVGWDTLAASNSASDNTCLGYVTCQNLTGGQNTAVGSNALKAGSNSATQNTGVGYGALQAATTGASNTAVGYLAGSATTTGAGNVDLGNNALSAAGINNSAQIGSGTNPTGSTLQFLTWNLADSSGNTHENLTVLAVGSPIASGATIAPTTPMVHITGTNAIGNITVPSVTVAGGTFTGCIQLIPDGVWTTTAAGNISLASTAVVNRVMTMCYDGTKWNPSY